MAGLSDSEDYQTMTMIQSEMATMKTGGLDYEEFSEKLYGLSAIHSGYGLPPEPVK